MERPEPKFNKGDSVRPVSRKSEHGVITGRPRYLAGTYSYRVSFDGSRSNYEEEALELCSESDDPRDLFLDGAFGDADSCRNHLTYLRVNSCLSNYIYAFNNSRTRFYPHQFKPLLKFLDVAQGRLLMADEVGLGKTIEAGLLLVELEARGEQDRTLVVCPSKLRHKWRREMLEKFNFDYQILSRQSFLAGIQEIEANPYQPFRGILSYETMRSKRIMGALEETGMTLNTVIADEAHILRNRRTKGHRAFMLLADRADNVMLLSATPINNKSEDLFNLLQLINPKMFPELAEFHTFQQKNIPVVELERRLRHAGGDTNKQCLDLLAKIETNMPEEAEGANYLVRRLRTILEERPFMDLPKRIQAQRLAAKINLLNRHIARTRRCDVDEKRPQREPHVLKEPMKPEERVFYSDIVQVAMEHYKDFRLPVINLERILSSCIPAFIDHYLSVLDNKEMQVEAEDTDDDPGSDKEESSRQENAAHPLQFLPGLRTILQEQGRYIRSHNIDSKYETLLKALEELDRADPGCKLIIFSYFRNTIQYLSDRLNRDGYKNIMLHGGIPSTPENPETDEREQRQRQFADPRGPRILISSEVGSEGLDFQSAHVLINYDLPWNPMRVEQRIGRIDRIGQQEDKLLIYSLLLEETIDIHIYGTLLEKIGIFRCSLGDLESILGNEVKNIQDAAFSPKLNDEEKKKRIDKQVEIIERKGQAVAELEKERSRVIGTDQYLAEKLGQIRDAKRYVSPEELEHFCHHVLSGPQIGFNIQKHPDRTYSARVPDSARRFFLDRLDKSREALTFRYRLHNPILRWTFDYEQSLKDPALVLFNQRHPAVRVFCQQLLEHEQERSPVFRVQIAPDKKVPTPSPLVLAIYLVEYQGFYNSRELETVAMPLDGGETLSPEQSDFLLSQVITTGGDWEGNGFPMDKATLVDLLEKLDATLKMRTLEKEDEQNAELKALLAQRRQQINWRADRLRQSRVDAMANLQKKDGDYNALIKAHQARIDNIEKNRRQQLAQCKESIEVTSNWNLESLCLVAIQS